MRATLKAGAGVGQQGGRHVPHAAPAAPGGEVGVRPVRIPGGTPAAELAAAAHLLHQRPEQHVLDVTEACGQSTPPGQRMLRADIIPTGSGYYFCELNHFSGVGAGEGYHSAHAFAELLGRPVAGVSPFRQLAHQYITECRRAGLSRVVVLDTTKHRAQGFGECLMLQRYLRLMAPDLETSYRDEHTYPADWLRPDEAKRTLVHRLVTHDDPPDGGAFLVRLRDSGATVTTMFEAELKMHRRWFSLLCDPHYQHLLDADELASIEQYVPHTYDLRPGTVDAAVAEKDRLVFKRSYTYGGQGVLIGDQHSPGQLRALLTADGSAWVAQDRKSVV